MRPLVPSFKIVAISLVLTAICAVVPARAQAPQPESKGQVKDKIANTGKKTLEYTDAGRHFQTSYSWSENPTIQELTEIFYGISNTMESANKLAFMKRYDKLGLPEQLQSMLELRSEGHLLELQTITPLLQKIVEDGSLMNLARQRARQLIQSQ